MSGPEKNVFKFDFPDKIRGKAGLTYRLNAGKDIKAADFFLSVKDQLKLDVFSNFRSI